MSRLESRPTPRPGILDIEAYVPGKSTATGGQKVHKLSSNETPLGPSPAALDAYRSAGAKLDIYPDGSVRALREAIAGRFGLDPTRIICGNGSDDILHLLAAAYIGPGDEGIMTVHGFQIYKIAILAAGGKPIIVPEVDLTASVDEILARVGPRTKAVFIANPNNPTGTYLPFEEIKRLHAALPANVLLVLDAAYAEYVRRNDYSAGLELVSTFENVVMTRTFSKIFGLASLRIGWAYAPVHVCDALNRIRGPFNVSGPAIADLARMDDGASAGAGPEGHAQRREFCFGSFPAVRGPDGCRRRGFSWQPWRDRAGRRVLQSSARHSHHDRNGRGQSRGRGLSWRVHSGNSP